MEHLTWHYISPERLDMEDLSRILQPDHSLALSELSRERIRLCRQFLEQKIQEPGAIYYGINTGFGSLCNIRISEQDLESLQMNLMVSHACGTGDSVPPEIVRIMLLLKIQSLSYGFSGVRETLVDRLIDFYNRGIYPVVFEQGSLGASGDLAPLAHLALPLAGLGEVWHAGQRRPGAEVLQEQGWEPLPFKAKEALAFLNGTQFSTAYGVWCLMEAGRLSDIADFNAALGYEAYDCLPAPLHEAIHRIRPHKGQITVAENLRFWLQGSEIMAAAKDTVQDPYSFRCVPQVHGATRDALDHIEHMLLTEVNGVTDNPNIFSEEDLILSGGNFHAQPVALPLDYLALALSELGNISERRTYLLISGQRGLPPFLTPVPGLHSGLMIAQYTAASIVSQNKGYCMPASADSIVSSNGQEDHVSMAANAGTKARKVVQNLERILAIEFLCGMQALDFRGAHRASALIRAVHQDYREAVPFLEKDRVLSDDIAATIRFLRQQSEAGTFNPVRVS